MAVFLQKLIENSVLTRHCCLFSDWSWAAGARNSAAYKWFTTVL